MIATINVHSHTMSVKREQSISRSSNSAGAPLPLIPRRTPSNSRTRPSPSTTPTSEPLTKGPVIVTLERPSPERNGSLPSSSSNDDSDSSTSLSDGTRQTVTRVKRVRGGRIPLVCPPEHSTPTPALFKERNENPRCRQSQINVVSAPSPPTRPDDTTDQSTPRPALPRPTLYTPGISLRLATEGMRARGRSESNIHSLAEVVPFPCTEAMSASAGPPRLVRKKSGQVLKSSLKATKPTVRGSLSVVTLGMSSKSEPNTPTHKAVHFDSHLEHVKLFLAEQKPLAVSRDGSPTDDTSGTDSDFPSFIYGNLSDEKQPRRTLVMTVVNMPQGVNLNATVALEDLTLSFDGTSILGRIRVRNLAFSKWIAVRFTFDSWQTTSEVTAKYLESLGSDYDRFTFSIRLNDLLPRIDEKILHLAVRYTVGGQEFWDNNDGNNYLASFVKTRPSAERIRSAVAMANANANSNGNGNTTANTNVGANGLTPNAIASGNGNGSGSDLEILQSRLERVVQGRDAPSCKLSPQAHVLGAAATDDSLMLQTHTSLASRYNWGTALKDPWTPPDFPPPPSHIRAQSHPAPSVPMNTSSIPWPEKPIALPTTNTTKARCSLINKPLGSPRDVEDDTFCPRGSESNSPASPTSPRDRTSRKHIRGYFDLEASLGTPELRRTPPGEPKMRSFDDLTPLPHSRYYSLAAADAAPTPTARGLAGLERERERARGRLSVGAGDLLDFLGASTLSTPSIVSSSGSSRDSSPSPTEEFPFSPITGLGGQDSDGSPGSTADYRQFINKFCFYTGSHGMPELPSAQTHSPSEVEELFVDVSPPLRGLPQRMFVTPNRSAVLVEPSSVRSGSSTPRATAQVQTPT